jgi:hypothetical protein
LIDNIHHLFSAEDAKAILEHAKKNRWKFIGRSIGIIFKFGPQVVPDSGKAGLDRKG